MPITKSAKKALRGSAKKKVLNDKQKKSFQNAEKQFERLVRAKKLSEASAYLSKAYKAIDKAAKNGVIKKNAAARKKSRLAKLLKKN
ncbi:MAG: 30S ribosomal protein S20 [Parcubacteria group bacterium GW2011_GWA2_40_8]|nr:MAG: 30S ribosomal protein S20 [Parcubacteria group bacterium GW2011_GWB1_40_14]KKR77622.1 MAG: 30S ribosomal protein S20 [Parcubacteria group bacterium GW2011_GWA2_40_8]